MSGLIVAASTTTAMADLIGISYEASVTEYGTTIQVFVDLEAGDQLNAVYGDGDNAMTITSTTSFFQATFGTATVAGMNPALFGFFPSLLSDSFVTIGLETNVGNAMLDIGIDFTAFESGGDIWTDNGSWFATPDDAQVYEVGGRVLIGQFTTTDGGALLGEVNLQGKNADGSNWTALGVNIMYPLPAPGALALLGIAGLISRRRRK